MSNCVLSGNAAGYGGGGADGGGTVLNCTFSNNWARQYGGGAYGCVLIDCVLQGNSAGILGGGSTGGKLTNCLVVNNQAGDNGGGSYGEKLINCTLTGNIVTGNNPGFSGGGVGNASIVANCIVYSNSAPQGANYYDSPMVYCCTFPAISGAGNITNPPLFADPVNGDYRLQSNSPCINAGKNSYVQNTVDLDGNPRIVGGTVDIGGYEFQTSTSIISYAWLQQYGLPTDGSADFIDTDGDGMNNWKEWICGTDPTNALSVLKMIPPSNNLAGVTVPWASVSNRTYYLQRSTNLAAQPAFSTVQSNIAGQAGTTSFTDTNAIGRGPFFYRVGVQ
jgi:parallel beta-helix repeat protein